jgi:hypothetical protein
VSYAMASAMFRRGKEGGSAKDRSNNWRGAESVLLPKRCCPLFLSTYACVCVYACGDGAGRGRRKKTRQGCFLSFSQPTQLTQTHTHARTRTHTEKKKKRIKTHTPTLQEAKREANGLQWTSFTLLRSLVSPPRRSPPPPLPSLPPFSPPQYHFMLSLLLLYWLLGLSLPFLARVCVCVW